MTDSYRNVMARAISIRLKGEESFEEIVASYPKLDEDDIAWIKKKLGLED